MVPTIDALLRSYERGMVSRRELLKALGAVAIPGGLVADAREGLLVRGSRSGVLRGININHVNLQVSDLDVSADYYQRLFGLPALREIPGRPYALDLGDGLSFVSMPQREPHGTIDHFCVGVEDFEPELTAAALRDAGFDRGLRVAHDNVSVTDLDGLRVQISAPNWTG